MSRNALELPIGPLGARLFVGYRAAVFAERPEDDEATRASKRADFFKELGATFMPGTPLMQAPLGLAAYLPVVLDTPADSGLPDEVAAIVYASRPVYDRFRETSLSRRIYTRAHVAVFDMVRSVAQFPATLAAPTTHVSTDVTHHFTFMDPEAAVDWQSGALRCIFLVPDTPGEAFRQAMLQRLAKAPDRARTLDVDQILMVAADRFAALWIHADQPLAAPLQALDLLPEGARVLRELDAVQVPVRGDQEPGLPVTGPMAITFRFERRLDLFDPPPGPTA